ncbi:MAG TPA: peptidylprolyl isomerase, partial [Pirellulales bacterium]|nr:peptidylprolyl isomerase [Pirellulales bacterium]
MEGNHRDRVSLVGKIVARGGWLASGVIVVSVCLAFRWYAPAGPAVAASKPPSKVKQASATQPVDPAKVNGPVAPRKPPVAALVNNEPVSREDLAQECLLHFGTEVLETLVNRMLIMTACQKRGIEITDQQIEEEVDRMARKFSMGKDQWLQVLEKERGIKRSRYARDIIWPTLALRELAQSHLTVSKKELDEAFEGEFGPAVKVRLIALDKADEAKRVHAEATAKPEEFPALAKKYSKDSNSASAYGLIQPIRRHSGDPTLEDVAFALKKGEISKIVLVGNLYVFVKCEEQLPAMKGVDREKYEPQMTEALKDRKLRSAAGEVFKDLQKDAVVENIYNDPVKSKQMPGVAALINGNRLTLAELADECISRHGTDVLEGTINRRLLDQQLRKKNLKIGQADIDTEIGRAAVAMGKTNARGEPDIEGWMDFVTNGKNITREIYIRDEVWPSVALKKLVGDNVPVTKEDLSRGYEANYGPKVRCRAIVLNNQRRAQEVWEKARSAMTASKKPQDWVRAFGDLAEQYSIEGGSRALRGEVPPIQKYGGQPVLEKEAFSLKPIENPLSGLVQVGDTYVILFCEGYTKPIDTSFEEVKDLLYRDIHEKKQRIAMARTFDAIKDASRIDNYLSGDTKAPKHEQSLLKADLDPDLQTPKTNKMK